MPRPFEAYLKDKRYKDMESPPRPPRSRQVRHQHPPRAQFERETRRKSAATPRKSPSTSSKSSSLGTTDEGDLVLDPFLGSGTTAAAAKKLQRNGSASKKTPTTSKSPVDA
jgi:hypothetical protein